MANQNPNCVLTAVAEVGWPAGAVALHVEVSDALGQDAGVTPSYAIGVANPQVVPVLNLRASTTYTLRAVATLGDGGAMISIPTLFATEALPPTVPTYTVADGGQAGGPYTLIDYLPTLPTESLEYISIVDDTGAPVWYLMLPPFCGPVGDFQKQPDGTYTVATYYNLQGIPPLPGAPTRYIQYDVLGNVLKTWTSPDLIATDEHELRILPDGSALLNGWSLEQVNMGAIFDGGQPDAGVFVDVLERIAPDGGVLFSWSTAQIPLSDIDPDVPVNGATVDAYHTNAIDLMSDGNYLLSIRDTSEVIKIDSTTGAILWILGGPRSTFTLVGDSAGGFSQQHGARELPNGDIILFDDGDDRPVPYSRAVEYALDLTATPPTATRVWQAIANPPLYTYLFGFAQRLDNGNTLIAYGDTRHVQEVGPDAGLLWDLYDPRLDNGIYRAFRIDTLY